MTQSCGWNLQHSLNKITETDGRTDTTDRVTLPANAIGKCVAASRRRGIRRAAVIATDAGRMCRCCCCCPRLVTVGGGSHVAPGTLLRRARQRCDWTRRPRFRAVCRRTRVESSRVASRRVASGLWRLASRDVAEKLAPKCRRRSIDAKPR